MQYTPRKSEQPLEDILLQEKEKERHDGNTKVPRVILVIGLLKEFWKWNEKFIQPIKLKSGPPMRLRK